MSYTPVEQAVAGDRLPSQQFLINRVDLVRYAGASGDFTPIHWSEHAAISAGLPSVVAHGLLTMALACRVVTDWTDDPTSVVNYCVRFSAPLCVPVDKAASLSVEGLIESRIDADHARVRLTVRSEDTEVLTEATAIVRLTRPSWNVPTSLGELGACSNG